MASDAGATKLLTTWFIRMLGACWVSGVMTLATGSVGAAVASIDVITRNEVLVKAPPEKVWPYIVDVDAWKQGPKLILVSGNPATVGATFDAAMPDDPNTILFHAENVEIVPPLRRTLRFNLPDGTLLGFATWELTPERGSTRILYRVFSSAGLPPEDAATLTAAQLADTRAQNYEMNRKRFDAELRTLKHLVESH